MTKTSTVSCLTDEKYELYVLVEHGLLVWSCGEEEGVN